MIDKIFLMVFSNRATCFFRKKKQTARLIKSTTVATFNTVYNTWILNDVFPNSTKKRCH